MKRCVINVSIGSPYVEYQQRLKNSLSNYNYDTIFWTNELPIGSKPHNESMYGFKMYAFKEAFARGCDSVIWLDSPTELHTDIDYLFDIVEKENELVVNANVPLYQYCNEATIKHYGYTPQQVKDNNWVLNYGFVFGFTSTSETYIKMSHAESVGLFTTAEQDWQDHLHNTGVLLNGEYIEHRHEESILSMIVQSEGRTLKPYSLVENKLSHAKTPL